MTKLANTVSATLNSAIASEEDATIWRGVLDDSNQNWKIVVMKNANLKRFDIRIQRRDAGDGEPE